MADIREVVFGLRNKIHAKIIEEMPDLPENAVQSWTRIAMDELLEELAERAVKKIRGK